MPFVLVSIRAWAETKSASKRLRPGTKAWNRMLLPEMRREKKTKSSIVPKHLFLGFLSLSLDKVMPGTS